MVIKNLLQVETSCVLQCNNGVPLIGRIPFIYFTNMTPTIYKWNLHVFFRVLHKGLYCENSDMRFLWHHDNGKVDHNS